MNALPFAALAVVGLLGGLIVLSLWPRERSRRSDAGLILPLGFLVGLGATSVIFFVASLLSARPALLGGALELVATAGLIWRLARERSLRPPTPAAGTADAPGPCTGRTDILERLLALVAVPAVIVAAVIVWRAYEAEPLGGWDAWTIWNMHARFMLRGGTEWIETLSASPLSWTHPDYPRLVSASVARVWDWSGEEAPLASALVSVGFAVATVALLAGVVVRRRGRVAALAGLLALLGTPFFLTFAPNQHADIPLGGFMLAAVALILMTDHVERPNRWWALAGLCVGFAAWTKNEGLLFALGLSVVVVLRRATRTRWSGAGFLLALAIALVPVIGFKLVLAPVNDLMSAPLGPRLAQVFDPARHATILAAAWRDLRSFGEWQVAPWLAFALPFVAWRARTRLSPAEQRVPIVLAVMLAGYYVVYLLSPQALAWHLDTSLVRLLLQLWPLAILTWCLLLPPFLWLELPSSRSTNVAGSRALFVIVSGILTAGVLGALSSQRGTDELVVHRIGGAPVTVSLGEGWYPLETHARDEWAWSGGSATLRIHVGGSEGAGPATLRFGLRGTGERTVTVRSGEEVVWQGVAGPEYVAVALTDLRLRPGFTTLEFSTDTPAVAESAQHGGRALAFALFNVRLK